MKLLSFALLSACALAQQRPVQPQPIQPKPEELQRVKQLADSMATRLGKVKASRELIADVAVYEKAGRMLLEFPDEFGTQDGIARAISVLEEGNQRAEFLAQGQAPWTKGKKRTHAFVSDLDGSLQAYGVTIPESYDGWMHGRAQRLTESEFLYTYPRQNASRPPVADYPAAQHFPALIYPNPMSPSRYVVINTGLTFEDREYRGDYNMPRLGDYAVMKVKEDAEVADSVIAGLFNSL